mgnify:FL=1
MTKYQRLYDELRQYVEKDKVREYDVDFFSKKRQSKKSMNIFLNKYFDIETIKYQLTGSKSYLILSEIINSLSKEDELRITEINKSRDIARHFDRDFLFKDSQYLK